MGRSLGLRSVWYVSVLQARTRLRTGDAPTDSLQPTASTAIRRDYLMVKGSRRGQASLRCVTQLCAHHNHGHRQVTPGSSTLHHASSENLQPHAGTQAHTGITSTRVSQFFHNREYYSQGHQYWGHPQAAKDGDSPRLSGTGSG